MSGSILSVGKFKRNTTGRAVVKLRYFPNLIIASVSLFITGLMIPGGPVLAAGYSKIYMAIDPGACIDDPSNNGQSGDLLIVDTDNGNCPLTGEKWTYSPSSYSTGYEQLILYNHTHGTMCIDDRGGNSGTQVAIKTCNGSASQAWFAECEWLPDGGVFAQVMGNARGKTLYWNLTNDGPLTLAVDTGNASQGQVAYGPLGIPQYFSPC